MMTRADCDALLVEEGTQVERMDVSDQEGNGSRAVVRLTYESDAVYGLQPFQRLVQELNRMGSKFMPFKLA